MALYPQPAGMYATQAPLRSVNPADLPPLRAPSLPHGPRHVSQQALRDDEPAILPPLRNLGDHSQPQNASNTSAEYERTRQEKLKLERYKVKRDMLRELLRAGVHPSQIPAFFADMDKSDNLPSPSSAPRYGSTQTRVGNLPQRGRAQSSPQMPQSSSPQAGVFRRWISGNLTQRLSTLAPLTVDRNVTQQSGQPDGAIDSRSNLPVATNKPPFRTGMFSTSPRALQFKFYNPGPKQKGLRRTRGSISGPPNGIQKGNSRGHSRTLSGTTSHASPNMTKAGHKSTSTQGSGNGLVAGEDMAVSDMDNESDEMDNDSGSEVG